MKDRDAYATVRLRKKPFYIWIFRLVWAAWLLFWLEVAVGSRQELEPRAYIISLSIFALSLVAGLFFWFLGLRKNR